MNTVETPLRTRICELLEPWQPWQRRLWDLGTVLALREAVEAADWSSRRVLSQGATSWYTKQSLPSRLSSDAALGDKEVRKYLRDLCQRPIASGTRRQRSLDLLTDLVADGYLARWRSIVASGSPVHVERAARCVAAHMLDLGFNQHYLQKEVKTHVRHGASVVDLLDAFIDLEGRGERTFTGVIVLQGTIPNLEGAQQSSRWMSREDVSSWLTSQFPGATGIRATGGLCLEVQARDPYSAAHEITEIFDRLRNRIRYRRKPGSLTAHSKILIAGEGNSFEFIRGDQAVSITSLERAGVLFDAPTTEGEGIRIDDALELAAPLTGSSPSTAIAGAWAALESLLFCDTDEADREEGRAVAADRAAAIVTAAWPRAELTALSYQPDVQASNQRLRQELKVATDGSRRRAQIVLKHLMTSSSIKVSEPREQAALDRILELSQRPYPVLARVDGYMRGAFRRLYRQRNIVLHGGSTRSVALRASVRTAGPLVGAALDRIAYAYTIGETPPLQLASQAQLAIAVVNDRNAWQLHELLGA